MEIVPSGLHRRADAGGVAAELVRWHRDAGRARPVVHAVKSKKSTMPTFTPAPGEPAACQRSAPVLTTSLPWVGPVPTVGREYRARTASAGVPGSARVLHLARLSPTRRGLRPRSTGTSGLHECAGHLPVTVPPAARTMADTVRCRAVRTSTGTSGDATLLWVRRAASVCHRRGRGSVTWSATVSWPHRRTCGDQPCAGDVDESGSQSSRRPPGVAGAGLFPATSRGPSGRRAQRGAGASRDAAGRWGAAAG